MKKDKSKEVRKGISLIVLIISIIVVIILVGAVILNITNNNPVESARKARFLNDVDTFKSELSMYHINKQVIENYNGLLLHADKESVSENGINDTNKNITNVINSMKNTNYEEKFEIIAGELVYAGSNENESNWCDGIIESKEFKIDISVMPDANDLVVNIKLTGALIKESNVEWYKVYIKKISEEYNDIPDKEITEKSLLVSTILNENIETDTEYIVKVEVKMLNESEPRIKESEKFVTRLDVIEPNTPVISAPSILNTRTIENIVITQSDNVGGSGINKNAVRYIVNKESTIYDKDNGIWDTPLVKSIPLTNYVGNIATVSETVASDGEYYVHVLSVDNVGNKTTGISSKIVVKTVLETSGITCEISTGTNWTNIDPTVTLFGFSEDVTIKQYTLSGSNTWVDYIAPFTVSRNGDINVRVEDVAGNEATKTFTVDKIDKLAPNTFTLNTSTNAGMVTITGNTTDKDATSVYGKSNIKKYQYKLDDGDWQDNNTFIGLTNTSYTVYMKAIDNAGNETVASNTETLYKHIDTGNSVQGGGCYTQPNYHVHIDACGLLGNGAEPAGFRFNRWSQGSWENDIEYNFERIYMTCTSCGKTLIQGETYYKVSGVSSKGQITFSFTGFKTPTPIPWKTPSTDPEHRLIMSIRSSTNWTRTNAENLAAATYTGEASIYAILTGCSTALKDVFGVASLSHTGCTAAVAVYGCGKNLDTIDSYSKTCGKINGGYYKP